MAKNSMRIGDSIRTKLIAAYKPTQLFVENESSKHGQPEGAETHFKVLIVSDSFIGMSRIDRQRGILGLFEEERDAGLHAFSVRALSPAEYTPDAASAFKTPSCHDGLGHDPVARNRLR